MKTNHTSFVTCLISLMSIGLFSGRPLAAQSASSAATTEETEEPVVLSPFSVTSSEDESPYQAPDATAASRVRVNIMDSGSAVSVLTKQFLADFNAADLITASSMIAGVSLNNKPGIDRITIRGFMTQGYVVDGFLDATPQTPTDAGIVDRVEIVKGPNAVVSPAAVPGGTLTLSTKVAEFQDFGTISTEVGEYTPIRSYFDYNHVLAPKVSFRIVVAGQDGPTGDNQGRLKSLTVMPSVVYKPSKDTELTVQFKYKEATGLNYIGLPINPADGTTTRDISLFPGLSTTASPAVNVSNSPSTDHHSDENQLRMLFTDRVSDHLSIRLAARAVRGWEYNDQWNLLSTQTLGAYNPQTGLYVPYVVFGASPTFTPTAVTLTPSPLFTTSQTGTNIYTKTYDVQNDYVYDQQIGPLKTETTAGVSVEVQQSNSYFLGYTATAQANTFNLAGLPFIRSTTPTTISDTTQRSPQTYLNENVKLFSDRVILSGGIAKYWFYERTDNPLLKETYITHPVPFFKNYAVVIRPIEQVSLYYGHSESGSQVNNPPSPPPAYNPDLQVGKQDEAGVRLLLFKKLRATVDYYNITQTNNSIINPLLYTNPPPTVAPPPLLEDRIARGWEYEISYDITPNLSLLTSYTNFKNRNPQGVAFRGTAENSGGGFLSYKFRDGAVKGLMLAMGYEHSGRRPGDTPTGLAAGSTVANPIPNQPSFYLPAYGVWNLSTSYSVGKQWQFRFLIDNLTDTMYFAGSQNRNSIIPGTPRNFRGSIDFHF